MKVLLLLRQELGGLATYADDLVREMPKHGIEPVIEEASAWIPNETGPKHDKKVSRRLRELASSYDLVHALGYRTAWACSAAFGHKEAWVYTAYNLPKTTHRVFISRLNDAQAGICASRAIYRALDEAIAIDLTTSLPGVRTPPVERLEREDARRLYGLPPSAPVIGCLGRHVPEHGFRSALDSMGIVWANHPDAILVLGGDGSERADLEAAAEQTHRPDQIRFAGRIDNVWEFYAALDLFVVPSTRAGFSMAALEAMASGVPTMVRATGGLIELVEPDISGFVFRAEEELGSHISEVLDLPLTLQTVGAAGRVRASETFSLEHSISALVEIYQGIVAGD